MFDWVSFDSFCCLYFAKLSPLKVYQLAIGTSMKCVAVLLSSHSYSKIWNQTSTFDIVSSTTFFLFIFLAPESDIIPFYKRRYDCHWINVMLKKTPDSQVVQSVFSSRISLRFMDVHRRRRWHPREVQVTLNLKIRASCWGEKTQQSDERPVYSSSSRPWCTCLSLSLLSSPRHLCLSLVVWSPLMWGATRFAFTRFTWILREAEGQRKACCEL